MTAKISLLLVDDEPNLLLVLSDMLSGEPYQIHTAQNYQQALDAINKHEPEIVLCDLRLVSHDSKQLTGLDLFEKVSKSKDAPLFIFLTAHGDVETAVKAIKLGAFDFLLKPCQEERLLHTISLAAASIESRLELSALRAELNLNSPIFGSSKIMQSVREKIRMVAPSTATVLITGESGSGKELAARSVYEQSERRNKPLVTLNCAVLSKELIGSELFGHERGAFTGAIARRRGKFELADKATLFLDEIGELSLEHQAKLLRVIEDGVIERLGAEQGFKVNVRIIAATNRELELEVEAGRFRSDLYHRLKVFEIKLPALSEHSEDITELAEIFLKQFSLKLSRVGLKFSDNALTALKEYHWPGNVRELRNVIERAVIMSVGSQIEVDALALSSDSYNFLAQSTKGAKQGELRSDLEKRERDLIVASLERNNWVQARAARELGLNRSHLHYKIKRLSISQDKK